MIFSVAATGRSHNFSHKIALAMSKGIFGRTRPLLRLNERLRDDMLSLREGRRQFDTNSRKKVARYLQKHQRPHLARLLERKDLDDLRRQLAGIASQPRDYESVTRADLFSLGVWALGNADDLDPHELLALTKRTPRWAGFSRRWR